MVSIDNIKNALDKQTSKVFVYDLAALPSEVTPEVAIKYFKINSIAFINSKESELIQDNMNQYNDADLLIINEQLKKYAKHD